MYLKTQTVKKANGKSYTYYRLAESYRENGKVKHMAAAMWQGFYGEGEAKQAGIDYVKHVEHITHNDRALAEGLRVQFYWQVSGVSDRMQNRFAHDNFLQKQDGYLRRELLKGEGKQWVDLVYWSSAQAAARAAEDANTSEAFLEYFSLMVGLEDAEDALGGLAAAGAHEPGHADDLARAHQLQ